MLFPPVHPLFQEALLYLQMKERFIKHAPMVLAVMPEEILQLQLL